MNICMYVYECTYVYICTVLFLGYFHVQYVYGSYMDLCFQYVRNMQSYIQFGCMYVRIYVQQSMNEYNNVCTCMNVHICIYVMYLLLRRHYGSSMYAADRDVLDRQCAQDRKEGGKGTYLCTVQKLLFHYTQSSTRSRQFSVFLCILLYSLTHTLTTFYLLLP